MKILGMSARVYDVGEPVHLPRLWFVGFCGQDEEWSPLHLINPPGFRHAIAFAYETASNRYIVYDVTLEGTLLFSLAAEEFDGWLGNMRARGMRVLGRRNETVRTHHIWMNVGFHCVTAVKHLLGVGGWAVRPIDLWRNLRRAGYEEYFVNVYRGLASGKQRTWLRKIAV